MRSEQWITCKKFDIVATEDVGTLNRAPEIFSSPTIWNMELRKSLPFLHGLAEVPIVEIARSDLYILLN